MNNSAVLLISCPDRKGLVAMISDFVFRHNGNILHADEHADEGSNLFLMRVEFDRRNSILILPNSLDIFRQLPPKPKWNGDWLGRIIVPR